MEMWIKGMKWCCGGYYLPCRAEGCSMEANTLNMRTGHGVHKLLVTNIYQKMKMIQEVSPQNEIAYICNCKHPRKRTLQLEVEVRECLPNVAIEESLAACKKKPSCGHLRSEGEGGSRLTSVPVSTRK